MKIIIKISCILVHLKQCAFGETIEMRRGSVARAWTVRFSLVDGVLDKEMFEGQRSSINQITKQQHGQGQGLRPKEEA